MNEALNKTREIRKRELQICCPVCGKHKFNMEEGKTSFQCEKCGAYVVAIVKQIAYLDTVLRVYGKIDEEKEPITTAAAKALEQTYARLS